MIKPSLIVVGGAESLTNFPAGEAGLIQLIEPAEPLIIFFVFGSVHIAVVEPLLSFSN